MLKRTTTLLLGIGLIGLGVLFFVAPERVFAIQLLARLWPLFLVLAGLVRVAGYLIDHHPRSPVGGMILAAVGGILLAANLRGEQSPVQIIGYYWFWLLLALILGRVLQQYTHRPQDGPRPYAFSPWAIALMLIIIIGGLTANHLAKKSLYVNGLNLSISNLGNLRQSAFEERGDSGTIFGCRAQQPGRRIAARR
jgi:FtsH-binding integral membrane protein